MFGFFRKNEIPLLRILVNDDEVCEISEDELPCEKLPSRWLGAGSAIEFIDRSGDSHKHDLGNFSGWFHFSVRVHQNKACQVDCAITEDEKYDNNAFSKGKAKGLRFQPFFIAGAETSNDVFIGKGLFKRGLHFNGNITHGSISLSCECDHCRKSFIINSFHAGFSNVGYFYSDSGAYTLTVSDRVPGCPAALSIPDESELKELESQLPLAPDGTKFKYTNSFNCPHCKKPYIDFTAHPEERAVEYYGNYFPNREILKYEPIQG